MRPVLIWKTPWQRITLLLSVTPQLSSRVVRGGGGTGLSERTGRTLGE